MVASIKFSYPVETVRCNGRVISRVPEKEYRETLDLFAAIGIDGVMLSGYAEIEAADFDLKAETRQVGRLLNRLGLRCSQHHGLCPTFAPLEESQKMVVDMLRREIEYTANLGAEVLVIHPGRRTGRFHSIRELLRAYEREAMQHSLEHVIAVCAENLHAAGEFAAECGVRIALENVDRFEPLASREHLPRLVEMSDSSAVGFCFDSGHAHCCGRDPVEWIEMMGGKLFATHIHDNHGPRGIAAEPGFLSSAGIDEHLPPGFGTIDWFSVISALHRIGYDRTVNFESGPWPGELREGYRRALHFWKSCKFYVNRMEKLISRPVLQRLHQ